MLECGRYAVRAAPGRKKVEILGFKTVGQRRLGEGPDAEVVDVPGQIVPEKFNRQSELTVAIDGGDDGVDFHLKSP